MAMKIYIITMSSSCRHFRCAERSMLQLHTLLWYVQCMEITLEFPFDVVYWCSFIEIILCRTVIAIMDRVEENIRKHLTIVYAMLFLLFNDSHVLHLRPEIVAVRRRMRNDFDDYDGRMVSRDKCDLTFLIFILQLRENPGKKPLPGKWPDRDLNPGLLDER